MADIKQRLRARLAACQAVLGQLVATSRHAAVSQVQSAAVIALIEQIDPTTPEERANLTQTILDIQFAEADSLEIISSLNGDGGRDASKRKLGQDYQSIHGFGTMEFWTEFASDETGLSTKLELLFKLADSLRCRLINEKTGKLWLSMVMTAKNADEWNAMTPDSKKNLTAWMRKQWTTYIRNKTPVPKRDWIQALPSSPQQVRRMYPRLWETVYGDGEGPVPCRIDISRVILAAESYQCRGDGMNLEKQLARVPAKAAPTMDMFTAMLSMVQQQQQHQRASSSRDVWQFFDAPRRGRQPLPGALEAGAHLPHTTNPRMPRIEDAPTSHGAPPAPTSNPRMPRIEDTPTSHGAPSAPIIESYHSSESQSEDEVEDLPPKTKPKHESSTASLTRDFMTMMDERMGPPIQHVRGIIRIQQFEYNNSNTMI